MLSNFVVEEDVAADGKLIGKGSGDDVEKVMLDFV